MKTVMVYPELPLYIDAIEIRRRIQQLPPLRPSATPLQKRYREDLDMIAGMVPEIVPGSSDSFPPPYGNLTHSALASSFWNFCSCRCS
jgi:hypothetical protein